MCKLPGVTLNKFNIDLLAKRLAAATEWIMNSTDAGKLQLGYFGSSTGAAAALIAASKYEVKSIVLRGGRTDLVDQHILERVSSPCLFIVGSDDKKVVAINKKTVDQLRNVRDKKAEIIIGASHLFEEEGKMEQVAKLASDWFKTCFKY